MTRERLAQLPLDSLHELARREGIEDAEELDVCDLIDLILEALEEDRSERESLNNHPIRMEEKKYVLSPDEDFDFLHEEEFPLPARYNESKIVLMLRDPSWAFAYWEIKESDQKKMKNEPGFEGVFLRVHEILGADSADADSLDYFDIPIQFSDSRWYINLPKQGTNYYIQLYALIRNRIQIVAESNVITVPRGSISEDWGKGDSIDPYDLLIALSGLDYLGLTSYGKKIPQRIISMLDAHYLR